MSLLKRIARLWLAVFATSIIAACGHPIYQAQAEVPLGTLREDAVTALADTAWYHQVCPRQSVIDLFFYGSHDYDQAQIVIVTSTLGEDGALRVASIGTFEPYAWHTGYDDCIQRERFTN